MGLYSSQMMAELQRRPKTVSDLAQSDVGQAMSEGLQFARDNPGLVLDVALIATGGGLVVSGMRRQAAGWAMASRRQGIKTIESGYRRKLKGKVLSLFGLERQADEHLY
jgi:hypothetical protein